jgi:dipeptidase D
MDTEIRNLQPEPVWKSFANLNQVPRPSKKEARVIQFMLAYGRSLGLETFGDPVGNVIIRKPASDGMGNRKPVILQAHLDMVHQKNNHTRFDFDREGINMYIDGDWVKANGTTLGADNGLGVAAIMAVLADKELAHPPLEALFTVDEETGMTGAKGLEAGLLEGKILLNLDTEEDDEIDIGCAGGLDVTAQGTYEQLLPELNCTAFTIFVKGLQGGHSGIDIHLGLGNANKIMNRILQVASDRYELKIANIAGGGLRNAIPRESVAHMTVPESQKSVFEQGVSDLANEISSELSHVEPQLEIRVEPAALPSSVMPEPDQRRLLLAISEARNGVYRMSKDIPGLVETSNNLARVNVKEGRITVGCLTRSSVDGAKTELADALRKVFEKGGLQVDFSGEYPGWTPDPTSEILKLIELRYRALFGKEPRVVACHAGLECGIIGATYPRLDMVSFGPTIRGAHSPDERVKISSVRKFWTLLTDLLASIPPQ